MILRRCESDADYARFMQYYIRNRTEFNRGLALADALEHVMQSLSDAHILLLEGEGNELIGWVQYRYAAGETAVSEGTEGNTVFVDSAVIVREHRCSRVFFEGFRVLAARIAKENDRIRELRFHALADHAYLNRLYGKFAVLIGEHAGYCGKEHVYSAEFGQLLRYLRLTESE